jgi:hypothetical protein
MDTAMHTKQIKAIRLAVESLARERRRLYAAGEAAYNQGIRRDSLDAEEIKGDLFAFGEDDHENYVEYSDAIDQLLDMIEILTDPGAETEQERLL